MSVLVTSNAAIFLAGSFVGSAGAMAVGVTGLLVNLVVYCFIRDSATNG